MKKGLVLIMLIMFLFPLCIYAKSDTTAYDDLKDELGLGDYTKEEIIEMNLDGAQQNAKDNTITKLTNELNLIKKKNRILKKQNKELKLQKKIFIITIVSLGIVILFFIGVIVIIKKQ